MRGQLLVQKKKQYESLQRFCWMTFLILAGIIIFGLVFMYLLSQGPSPGKQLVTRTTPQTFAFPAENVPVDLIISPTALASSQPPQGGRELDILIGLDNSLSMTLADTQETALQRIKSVAQSFVDNTNLERHQIGIVRMDDQAQVIQTLSRNREVLRNVIDEIPEGSGTKLHDGLLAMNQELNSIRRRPASLGIAIILSDGRSNVSLARDEARRLTQQEGLFIAPIGIGDFVNDDLMRAMASWPLEYEKATTVEDLTRIYKNWTAKLEQLVAVNVTLREHYNDRGFKLEGASLNPPGLVRGKRLDWSLPFLTTRPETLRYVIQTEDLGWYQIDDSTGAISLQPVGQSRLNLPIHRKPKIIVLTPLLLLLLFLLPLIPLLVWAWHWWRRRQAALGPALLPAEIEQPSLHPPPKFLSPLDLKKLVRPTPPTLVIGLGGTGRWTLTYLKKAVLETNYGRMPDTIKFLLLDTHAREVEGPAAKRVQVSGVELDENEYLLLHEDPKQPKALLERTRKMAETPESEPHLKSWWPANDFKDLSVEQCQISRGTNQRRPFGRMAMFLDLEQGPEKSRFWSEFSAIIRKLGETGKQPTIFIASSLSGGTGSGMLIDVAYLVRHISEHEGLKGVTINALLALQNSFETLTGKLGFARPNAFAALRELDRFLACPDEHFPMQYSPKKDNAVNGKLEAPLLDNCYVFDADREPRPLSKELPEHGIFPAMADTIHTFLYNAAGGAFDAEVKQQKVVGELEREGSGHGVVSSLGTFVFRLPMFEFLQKFKYRFAKDLLAHHFGAVEEKGKWALAPLAGPEREEMDKNLDYFLHRDGEDRSPSDVLNVMALNDLEALIAIAEADRAHKDQETYVRRHKINFQRSLAGYLMASLNPERDQQSKASERRGQFAQAKYLATQLKARFESALTLAGAGGANLSDGNYREAVYELLAAYHDVVAEALNRFNAYENAVLAGIVEAKTGVDVMHHSMLQYLAESEKASQQHRAMNTAILVREYLYNDALEEQLYADYFGDEARQECLPRFVWHCQERDSRIEVQLKVVADDIQALDPAIKEPAENAERVTKLPELLAQEMWEVDITPYLQAAHPDPGAMAAKVYERAAPLIKFDPSQAVRHSKKLYLSLAESEYLDKALKHLYPNFPRRNQVKRTDFLDRHAFATVTISDSLPLPSLRPYQQAFTDYISVPDKTRSQLHLFAAEQSAAIYEPSLPKIQEPARAFHPRFISQLEYFERARWFALCVIYGLIPKALDSDNKNYRLEISDPSGDGVYDLTPVDPKTGGKREKATILDALQLFITGTNPSGPIPLDRIKGALARHWQMEAAKLKQTFTKRETEIESMKDNHVLGSSERDLISYIHLVLREEMEKQE